MPIDYKQYPDNWKTEIRPKVMARAGQVVDEQGKIIVQAHCEECKVENHSVGYRGKDGKFYLWEYIEKQLDRYGLDLFDDELKHYIKKDQTAKPATKIVLTVAHLDHDKDNKDVSIDRLRAWCQRCHLNYDRERHLENRKKSQAEKKKQLSLFNS